MGFAVSISQDGEVLDDAVALATRIAEAPLASLVATRRTLLAARGDAVARARQTEIVESAGLTLAPFR